MVWEGVGKPTCNVCGQVLPIPPLVLTDYELASYVWTWNKLRQDAGQRASGSKHFNRLASGLFW